MIIRREVKKERKKREEKQMKIAKRGQNRDLCFLFNKSFLML
jgi:hypothetical protein